MTSFITDRRAENGVFERSGRQSDRESPVFESKDRVPGREATPLASPFPHQVPFQWKTRIRFIDVDATGRIHNTSLLRYFESTEIEFLRSLGLDIVAMAASGFPRVRLECEFPGVIRFDDLVTFELRIGRLGNASVRFDYAAMKDGKMAARGSVTVVCVNPQTERPRALPEDLAGRLRDFAEPGASRTNWLDDDPRISYSGYLA